MRFPISHLMEVIVGGLLIIFGFIYLSAQSKTINSMTGIVNESLMEDSNIYQQDFSRNMNVISQEELIAIVMGYREYPITIDGVTINSDNYDYDSYLPLIKNGNYSKHYDCDSDNHIIQIIFTFIGVA